MRVWIRRVHLLSGALSGLFLVVAGVTGSALVFQDPLDRLLHPELVSVTPSAERAPLDAILADVRRAYPGERPSHLRMPRSAGQSLEITMAGEAPLQVYVDPHTGRILGERLSTETLPNMLFTMHVNLFAGHAGEQVMGWAAVLLLVLVLTGIVVWWPGLRAGVEGVRKAVSVRRGASWRRLNFDLHRAVGFWSLGFLALTAVTGASLVFHDAFMAGLNAATGSPPRPEPPAASAAPAPRALPLERVEAAGARALGGTELTYLILPTEDGGAVTVRRRAPEELHPNGRSFAYVDPGSGEVLAVEDARSAPLGTRLYNVLYPLHIGHWGGAASRIAYFVLGLAPVALAISGALAWWNRSGRRKLAPARKRRPPAPSVAGGRRAA